VTCPPGLTRKITAKQMDETGFIKREPVLPKAWTDDRARCSGGGIPEGRLRRNTLVSVEQDGKVHTSTAQQFHRISQVSS
jgi:hypothetical protein